MNDTTEAPGINPTTGLPITRPDDSFDDPTAHDGYPHPDRYLQLTRWGTARKMLATMAAACPTRPIHLVWQRAWTVSLDGRIRSLAYTDRIGPFHPDDEAWDAGRITIGEGPRRVLTVRKPGDRGES